MRHIPPLDKWLLLVLHLEERWSAVQFQWRSQQPATHTPVTVPVSLHDKMFVLHKAPNHTADAAYAAKRLT